MRKDALFDYLSASADELDATLAEARRTCPVMRLRDGSVLVIDHEHVQSVARRPDLFTARAASAGASAELDTTADVIAPLFDQDPDSGHTATRRALQPHFTRRRVQEWADYIRTVTQTRLAELLPRGRCDATTDIAGYLPWPLTAGLLGIPERQRDEYRTLAQAAFSPTVAASDTAAFESFLRDQIRRARQAPDDGMISTILATPTALGRLPTTAAVLRWAVIMSGAGSLTSRDLLSSILLHLADDRHMRARVTADRSLLPTLVDEMARHQSAVWASGRTARDSTQLGDLRLEPGTTVVQCWGAAARDPARHDNPDEVRLDRRPGAHLGWGSGPHTCIGRPLALVALPAILNVVLDAIPDFQLAPGASPRRTTGRLRGIDTLPLIWPTPGH
ncbi:cytochrome P450 [Saccharopolyspora elongata]|uniref:Cytochrome P450 n=1 Tax=Saccharopolyspora elongata TaxID=2530387 RepID=A0A4R4Y0M3_9PSEU|nr:cytochrome P450 [Saccharopolyspora elongata]TDD37771.1 cytochrome P450 [Saccharopolyspora elongata]